MSKQQSIVGSVDWLPRRCLVALLCRWTMLSSRRSEFKRLAAIAALVHWRLAAGVTTAAETTAAGLAADLAAVDSAVVGSAAEAGGHRQAAFQQRLGHMSGGPTNPFAHSTTNGGKHFSTRRTSNGSSRLLVRLHPHPNGPFGSPARQLRLATRPEAIGTTANGGTTDHWHWWSQRRLSLPPSHSFRSSTAVTIRRSSTAMSPIRLLCTVWQSRRGLAADEGRGEFCSAACKWRQRSPKRSPKTV